MIRIFYSVMTLFFFLGCSVNQTASLTHKPINHFEIYETGNKQQIDFETFLKKLEDYDIILLGEIHDQKQHHLMQKKIIENLSQKRKITLVFEMFGAETTKKLQEAQLNTAQIQSSDLPKALAWDKKWNYSLYKEIIEMAFYSPNILLKAGNLSREEIRSIYKNTLSLEGKLSTADAVKQEIANLILGIHPVQDENLLPKLVEVQQHKDRRMADNLIDCENLCILIAGNYHVSKKIGVPLHLMDLNPTKKFVTIGLGETLKDSADFVILFDTNKKK